MSEPLTPEEECEVRAWVREIQHGACADESSRWYSRLLDTLDAERVERGRVEELETALRTIRYELGQRSGTPWARRLEAYARRTLDAQDTGGER